MHWSATTGTYGATSTQSLRWRNRALLFLGIFAALSFGWNAMRGTPIEQWVINDATVRPAARLVNALTPELQARADGSTLRARGGGLNILNGCEGLDALFLLVAAMLVAPASARWRSAGLLTGMLFVFAINQLRILGLLYSYRSHPEAFQMLHGLVAPIGVILAVCFFFYSWLHLAARAPLSR